MQSSKDLEKLVCSLAHTIRVALKNVREAL